MNDPNFSPWPADDFERHRTDLRRALADVDHALTGLDASMQNVPAMEDFQAAWFRLHDRIPVSAMLRAKSAEELSSARGLWRAGQWSHAACFVLRGCAYRIAWRLLYSIGA